MSPAEPRPLAPDSSMSAVERSPVAPGTTEAGPLVLVVEDERPMARFLGTSLAAHGYRVVEATTAREARQAAPVHNPELVLLDLGLPDGDGLDVVGALREWTRVPIIVLSARGREEDKVAALDAGADDYLTKPFGLGELLARMRVALRRAATRSLDPGPLLVRGPVVIDRARREVRRGDVLLHLTPLEYRLLVLLAENVGKVMTHRQLLQAVWGPPYAGQTHYLRVYMAQLRRKVELDPARPRLLSTEPGVGYRMREDP
jgi:two-component system KDP operon response regulator KdpE